MSVNSGQRASFAQFRRYSQRRASMCIDDSKPHDGPSTQDILNGAATAVATAAAATATRVASFARFRALKQRRSSMCIDAAAKFDQMFETRRSSYRRRSTCQLPQESRGTFAKFKAMKERYSPMTSGALGVVRSKRKVARCAAKPKKVPSVSEPTLTRYNLSKLTNRRGEDQDPKKVEQFILVERNIERFPGMPSYSKMTYVINSTNVCAFYVLGDSSDTEAPRWSTELIVPDTSDDAGYNLIDKLSDMPKLKPIYCASRTVRSYEMTFPNAPQFLALFEEENFRQTKSAESVGLWEVAKDALWDRELMEQNDFQDRQLMERNDYLANKLHQDDYLDKKLRESEGMKESMPTGRLSCTA